MRIMKKIIIFSVIVATLFFTFTPSVQAKQQFFKLPIPAWFSQAIEPIQNTIKSLTSRIDGHEAKIAELEKKVTSLEEKLNNLEKQFTNHTNSLISPYYNGTVTIIPSEPVGIGTTNPTVELNFNCGSSDCQELLRLGE